MLFTTSNAIAYVAIIILLILLVITVIAYTNSVTEKITFKEAFTNTLLSFVKSVKKEISPTQTQAQVVYNPASDAILASNLRNQLSSYDGRQANFIGCNAGTFSSFNVPCIQMDFCPKQNNSSIFPMVCHSLQSVFNTHLYNCGIPVCDVYTHIQNIQQGFYYIYILYALTPAHLQALQGYHQFLRQNAIQTATTASAPVTDRMLDQDIVNGVITKADTGTSFTIGCNLEHHTAISADINQTGHTCIVGGTGSGKSMLTLYLLYNVCRLKMPIKLYIGDFKKSGDYKGISPYFAEFDKVVDLIDNFYTEFGQTKEGSTTIKILLIDEYAGFINWLAQKDKKKCEEIKGKISNLLMLGRSRHCYVWCIQQRISAQLFPSGIGAIDNFQICIGLGKLSTESRKSLFAGEHMDDASFENGYKPSTGRGLCLIDGQPLMAIGVPQIQDKNALKALLAAHSSTP